MILIIFRIFAQANAQTYHMTDNDFQDKFNNASTGELIKQIFILLGRLVLAILKRALATILKCIIWCIDKIVEGWHKLIIFWNSSDTQEKRRRIIAAIKQGAHNFVKLSKKIWAWTKKYTIIGAKLTWKYTRLGCKYFVKYLFITIIAIWNGILWTIRTTKDLIIHSKPTFIRLWNDIKKGSKDFWRWVVRTYRCIKLGHIRRRRAWQHFRRTKGFKGLLIDMGHGLTNGIKSFMEEDQFETDPEAITEDDIIAEQMDEKPSKANEISKKIFKGVKEIVEEI